MLKMGSVEGRVSVLEFWTMLLNLLYGATSSDWSTQQLIDGEGGPPTSPSPALFVLYGYVYYGLSQSHAMVDQSAAVCVTFCYHSTTRCCCVTKTRSVCKSG